MELVTSKYYKRDFWAKENLKYVEPHFRMSKAADLINNMVQGRQIDLLDVGCGPGTLRDLLGANIQYFGIDMAIHHPAPNLREFDFTTNAISFGDRKFDFVVAQGVFEYIGGFQTQKFLEIREVLKANGTFMVSYVNFDHLNRFVYEPYNNVQSFKKFRRGLEAYFHIKRVVPTSLRWHHDEPRKRWMKAIQMHFRLNVPVITRLFAVENFFVCSPRPTRR